MESYSPDSGGELRTAVSSSAATRSASAGYHPCPSCGTTTFPLAVAVRMSQQGDGKNPLTTQIPNADQVARWLKPPDVPADIRVRQNDVWAAPFFVAVVGVVIGSAGLMCLAILGWMVALPATLVGLALLYWRAAKPKGNNMSLEHEQHRILALKVWDRRMEVWERLGVCPQCGLMSDPVTLRTAEWHSVPSLFVG